ncbi:MAG: TetR/AcrR family transcriptional regulator [Deltaproteobacteria bacterium]|nr:TetR/AcrR family transcriptional regulator [Deltaproteobacteria bacterium]
MTDTEPKSRIPKQKRSEATRAKIIEAGIRQFSEQGYHSTSSKKIAREAGIAVGSFYNYFKDKKQLLFEIQRLHGAKVHEMLRGSLEEFYRSTDMDGRTFVRRMVQQALKLHEYSPELHREITALTYSDPDFAKMGREEDGRVIAIFMEVMSRQKESLAVDDLEAAVMVVGFAMEAVVHSIKIFGSPIEEKRLTDALGDMVYRFLYR